MKNLFVGCSMLPLLAISSLAGAQTAAPAGETPAAAPDGDIIVTAQKREQRLQDVGLAVAAISGEALAARRIVTLADLAQAVPGLIYTQSQANTPVYTLRGVGFFESSLAAYPDVATYIDQVPLPLPITSTLTAFDLERVEVLKGPQGTLFGNNATGGAINFIAAKPTRDFSAGVSLGYARFNTVEASGYVSGPLTDTLRARLAVKAVKGDEWQKSFTRDDKIGKTDNVAARLLVDWDATDRLKLSLNVNGWRDRNDPLSPQVYKRNPVNLPGTVGVGGTVPDDLPIFNTPLAPHKPRATDFTPGSRPFANNSFWQTALRGDYELADSVTLTSLSSYLRTKIDSRIEYDGTALIGQDLDQFRGKIRSFSQELRLTGDTGPLRWVVGGNYERTTVSESTSDLTLDSSSAILNGFSESLFFSSQKMRNYAAFANAEYEIVPRLTFKAGVRYTEARRTAVSGNRENTDRPDPLSPGITNFFNIVWGSLGFIYPNYKPIRPGESFTIDNRLGPDGLPLDPSTYGTAGTFVGRLKEHNTSWNVGLDYKATDDVLLYFNVRKGYKAGSFPTVAAAAWSQLVGIKQESLLDYEGGFKAQFFDRRLTLNGAAFYYDYKDKQLRAKIVDGIFGPLDALVNVPKSRITGAELELIGRPLTGLTINASGTYINAKVREYQGVVGSDLDAATGLRIPVFASFKDARLPFAPKWQLSGNIQYETALTESLTGYLGADVSFQTKSLAILAITASDKQDYEVRERALVGANIGFGSADGRWKALFWGKNIFNKYYTINTILDYDTTGRYAGRPAEYGVTLSWKL
ncbi:TonB-dependent receptor [Sphingomonas sp. ID0503]|uniref:TonB-dependent receptor n=1 Tax=Sphingomonas sp. ID0503 TaxID=3399691 RepID=UPI003AFA1C56